MNNEATVDNVEMIDTHAHVAFAEFDKDREAVARRARVARVRWVEIGTSVKGSLDGISLAKQYPQECLGATVGVHPSDIGELTREAWDLLASLLHDQKVVGVGEVGLDFYRGGELEDQIKVLDRFIKLALERDLPVVFHVRDGVINAHDALLSYLSGLAKCPRGVIHTFSGSLIQAEQYLELGLYLSFSGVVTFKNGQEVAQVATQVPHDRMLLETDCPFLAPVPHRGKRNEPTFVRYVGERISQLLDVGVVDVYKMTSANARALFGFDL